ncbi:MAG: PhoPQ-activated pathogenicity-related family protein [Verrucomicrobiota bacterium]|nr:PhoPQ-activated pathogenicity-related family protein [Verrucomicrobiota bacterium]
MQLFSMAWRSTLALLLGLLAGSSVPSHALQPKKIDVRTALDEYVAQPDTNYTWRVVRSDKAGAAQAHLLEMTSQAWLTTNEVNQPLWKHWLTVIIPEEVKHTNSLLFITGDSNDKEPPRNPPADLLQIATTTDSIVSELRMVPNQPLKFKGDGEERHEDSLVAYTWDRYLRTGDQRWPARLPMTKSAVRAMDTVAAFSRSQKAGAHQVSGFVVSGASKRGWTSWTTAAVDSRVVAIIPIVIDMLNVIPSFEHHYEAYGFWAPAVGDYEAMRIMDWTYTPEYKALMKIEEPFEYRDRLTLPKYLINATGDQFFLPDSAQFYWKELKGPKYLRYIPNTDHSLRKSDASQSLLAFYQSILTKKTVPEISWNMDTPGKIEASLNKKAHAVKLWQATNPTARDFRLETIGPSWASRDLDPNATLWSIEVPPPVEGWTAYFVEFTFEGKPAPLKFTTEVRVTPDTLPFKGKMPKSTPPK